MSGSITPAAEDRGIAVVGVSCRFPGGSDLEAFWQLLTEGRASVGETPPDRWKMAGRGFDEWPADEGPAARFGAFLDDVDLFDPEFFGISPREAAAMDPQQRLALELAWEALEDAGVPAETVRNHAVGVFIGAIAGDYASLAHRQGAGTLGRHAVTGLHRGIIANRVSHFFGTTGPSMTVDAAQSSSLVAVHLACESLRNGDSDLALVGGVHLNLDPGAAVDASRFGGLSPDGRCFVFDVRANGYVRGEGGGILALKPLAVAEASQDYVYCVIHGSAVNNGGDSEALTVPSRMAQEAVLARAWERSGLDRRAAQYVELHGTGTEVGDPIEAAALGLVLGSGRSGEALLPVGSVKTNIGHLEGAAGIAGLIKTALAIERRRIPASLNFERPNPAIRLEDLGLSVQDVSGPWPRADRVLTAGVSSFGMGGTNCHVVLSESPPVAGEPSGPGESPDGSRTLLPGSVLLPLSAKSKTALCESAEQVRTRLDADPELDPLDVGYSLATTRATFRHRGVAIGESREELLDALAKLALGEGPLGLAGRAVADDLAPVFVCPGQGSQWEGMAVELLRSSPHFEEHLRACEEALLPHTGWSVRDVLMGATDAPSIKRIEVVQPTLFAVTAALGALWLSCGVRPAAVLGHSQGEIAAAHIAGGLTLDDAARLVAVRSRIISRLAGRGAMVSIVESAERLAEMLGGWRGRIEVAARNSPTTSVLSADRETLDEFLGESTAKGAMVREVPATIPSHSTHVESLREELLQALAFVAPSSGNVPFQSTVTAEPIDTAELNAEYWYRNLRQPVCFEQAVRGLLAQGSRCFVEISPHPVLAVSLTDIAAEHLPEPDSCTVIGTLRRGEGGARRFAQSVAEAQVAGVGVDWEALFAGTGAERVKLPSYPFQRKRFWIPTGSEATPWSSPVQTTSTEGQLEDRADGERSAAPVGVEDEAAAFELIRAHVAVVLGHETTTAVDPNKAFKDLGLDSLGAAELRDRICTATGLRLPTPVIFNHPTVADLAKHLHEMAVGTRRRVPTAGAAAPMDEPIAIVGMACRYPGAVGSAADLWRLAAEGRDAISPFPDDRGWDLEALFDSDPDTPATSYAREGGFLEEAGGFDAEFFGISPREALAMDPQQRLLLEVAWEALEEAGVDPVGLRGAPAGVFVGLGPQDRPANPSPADSDLEGYRLTGFTTSVASGRIAYFLGLEGPAITVDTACSSSLVAIHLACQALRGGECELALAGGATVMGSPGLFTEFSRQRGLAPDGRCKAFAEAADGTGWGEGAGMLVLERLSDAQRSGLPVLATIRGSAVNQDGASNGLTAPNGPAQERVIAQALANARLGRERVDMVEAHGTGTTLGDPIEAGALLAAYGQDREEPLRVGSIKSNIGHTQAAAGVAGVIKAVQAMRHGTMPKTLHVDQPSSHVDWEAGAVEVLGEARAWPADGRPRRAGVSSFGISGTNAHLILEEAPAGPEPQKEPVPEREPPPLGGQILLPLSAKSEPALREAASRLAARVGADPDLEPLDVCYSLATGRAAFEQRAVLLGEDRGELLEGLGALAEGERPAGLVRGRARREEQPVFLFAGQGAQHRRMAAELLESCPTFARRVEECEEALRPHVDWSLEEVLKDHEGEWLGRLDVVQPTLFAVMVSLAKLWRDCGVYPAAVAGHSQGEIAAVHVAGALSLDEAARIAALRAKAMAKIAGKGAMAAIALPADRLAPFLETLGERVSLAAINGPASQAVSGDPEAIAELLDACGREGIRAQRIAVDYAAHSSQIDELEAELLEAFGPVSPRSSTIPFYSTVTGGRIDTAELDAGYWFRNLRETVRFDPALRSLLERDQRAFVEVSPHPVLRFGAEETIEEVLERPGDATVLSSLRREDGGPRRFAASLAQAHAHGVSVDWRAFFARAGASAVPLPTYPFQRKRYWLEPTPRLDLASTGLSDPGHPLLGAAIESPDGGLTLTGRLSGQSHSWLVDHVVFGTALLPGTAFCEMALAAAQRVGAQTLAELVMQTPLVVPSDGAVQLQVIVSPSGEEGEWRISIHSRPDATGEVGGAEWICHAEGRLAAGLATRPEPLASWPPVGAEPLPLEGLYEGLAKLGLEYGPAFRGAGSAWRAGEDIFAEVCLGPEEQEQAGRFAIHPALLDAAFHAASLDASLAAGLSEATVPFSWNGVSVWRGGAAKLRVKIRAGHENGVSVSVADDQGRPVASIRSLAVRPISPERRRDAGAEKDGLLCVEWDRIDLAPTAPGQNGDTSKLALLGELELPGDVERHSSLPALLTALEEGAPVPAAVVAPVGDMSEAALPGAFHACSRRALELVQAWLEAEPMRDSRLVVLTRRAVALDGESPDFGLAPVWGLVRSAQAEHPGRFCLLDLDDSRRSLAALPAALAKSVEEPQIALREGEARRPRIAAVERGADLLRPPSGAWRLVPSGAATVEALSLVPSPAGSAPLGPTEVRIAMRAAGLNFHEVLDVLGYDVPDKGKFGAEGAGVVTETGACVDDLAPGDRVMGWAPESFAQVAIAERVQLAPIPEGWSFEQAAAVPVAFATAYYGLVDLAGLHPGEKVLIHAAAGGVGSAAVQIARQRGAEVFATAAPAKWEALREAGIDASHIASSRDLDFRQEFLEATGGEGMDVVLNSLTGEFVDASLDLLPRGGRFLEMGKTDIRDARLTGRERPDVSYRAFELFEAGPERLGEILGTVLELFERGALRHVPITGFDLRRAPEALRRLREGRNVGKVVLRVPRPLDPGTTVLITGGTGAIGSRLARHLAEAHGARAMLLVSRAGPEAEGAVELREELERLGAEVRIAACDVADRSAVAELLASIPPERPLGAVVHAAGTLSDGTVELLGAEQLERVFAPKADAAWHLHELTADADLSSFVLLSSVAGTLGAAGQSNYAAANSFLDALAAHRRARGLPATSIALGLWKQETGMTSAVERADLARILRAGIAPFADDAEALARFDEALATDCAHALAVRLHRSPAGSALPTAPELATSRKADRRDTVLELVRAETAAVLGHASAETIGLERPFKDLGFDSLLAVELRNRLRAATEIDLEATATFDHPTPAQLGDYLHAEMCSQRQKRIY